MGMHTVVIVSEPIAVGGLGNVGGRSVGRLVLVMILHICSMAPSGDWIVKGSWTSWCQQWAVGQQINHHWLINLRTYAPPISIQITQKLQLRQLPKYRKYWKIEYYSYVRYLIVCIKR